MLLSRREYNWNYNVLGGLKRGRAYNQDFTVCSQTLDSGNHNKHHS